MSEINQTNADVFVDYYNRIDNYLNKSLKTDGHEPYSKKISRSDNPVVIRFHQELRRFGDLRNAIVHTEKMGGRVIAEPNSFAVDRIKILFKEICKPATVGDNFKAVVVGVSEHENLLTVLKNMYEKSYSQVPIFNSEGQVTEILSNNTIARWLAAQIDDDGSLLSDKTNIRDLLPFIEFKENYKFVKRSMSVYEAFEIFTSYNQKYNRNIDAVFITENGKKTEKLLGIITTEDIGKLGLMTMK